MKGGIEEVVKGGYCIGCGACAVADKRVSVLCDKHGMLKADISAVNDLKVLDKVCPFSDYSSNEDTLSDDLYPELERDPALGKWLACYAGWAIEAGYREYGSSGGLTTWLLQELISKNMVDGVIHVSEGDRANNGSLFSYRISTTVEQVKDGAKTRYYPIELSEVFKRLKDLTGRYAIVGVPCFIKSIRLLCAEFPSIDEKIAYTVGIVCGHLKSRAFAELFAWQAGIHPKDLSYIDFRTKLQGRPASNYGITMKSRTNRGSVVRQNKELFGADWGHGLFKYKSCDYCDDVLGETADISFGDAWLPNYVNDYRGANVVVTRRPDLQAILTAAHDAGRIQLEGLATDEIARSQASGLRHRREGLAYRLYRESQNGVWCPQKRVEPKKDAGDKRRQGLYDLRSELAEQSHAAFHEAKSNNDLNLFQARLKEPLNRYKKLYEISILRRALMRLKRVLKRLSK